jgi:hypothetical protein
MTTDRFDGAYMNPRHFFRPATIIGTLPNTLANGQTADAVPLMADLNWIVNQVNANAAALATTPQLGAQNSFTERQSGVAASSPANFPIASQVQNSQFITLSSVLGANTITARIAGLTLGAYTRGQVFTFVSAEGNSGPATVNIDSLGAVAITKEGGKSLASDDLGIGKSAIIKYRTPVDGLSTAFDLLNPGFTISGRALRSAGDILVGMGGAGQNSTLAVGSNLTLPFSSTGAATRIAWMSVNELPLASSVDQSNDRLLIHSNSIGTNVSVRPSIMLTAAIGQSQMLPAAVGQAELKTTTGDMTTTATSSLQTGPGGEYGFWPTIAESSNADSNLVAPVSPVDAAGVVVGAILGVSLLNRFHIGITNSVTATVRQRYVQASPPYDLGDGEVPLFVFMLINKTTGKPEHIWLAPDPPWANNGPTSIRADVMINGVPHKLVKTTVMPLDEARTDPAKMKEYLAQLKEAVPQPLEITQALKQADMGLIPHPFIGMDLSGHALVMVDPVSRLCQDLEEGRSSIEGGSVADLFYMDYMRMENKPLSRATPPGVIAVAASWKRTP